MSEIDLTDFNLRDFVKRRTALLADRKLRTEQRTEAILKELALEYTGSELFKELREAYAESDPAFRARMQSMQGS